MSLSLSQHRYTRQQEHLSWRHHMDADLTKRFWELLRSSYEDIQRLSEKLWKSLGEMTLRDMYDAGLLDLFPEFGTAVLENILEEAKHDIRQEIISYLQSLQWDIWDGN